MLTVFSVDSSPYQHWQAQLLAFSHRDVNQSGRLLRLLSGDALVDRFVGDTFRTGGFRSRLDTDDYYPPYNRLIALRDWLSSLEVRNVEATLLLLDPDCVFVRPLSCNIDRDQPMAQRIGYLDPLLHRVLVRRHCCRPAAVQSLGIPVVIHINDLREIGPRWLEKTLSIRSDPVSATDAGWIAEMWAYAFVAAEIGLYHTLTDFAAFPMQQLRNRPLIHYCYPAEHAKTGWRWNKRDYVPWAPVEPATAHAPSASSVLIRLLNRFGESQRSPAGGVQSGDV